MTVPANSDYVQSSIANGATDTFPFGFKVAAPEDLAVELDGVRQTGGYTVTGVGANSGSVVFTTNPVAGTRVTRYLDPVFKRDTNYQQFGDWMALVVNLDFDRIWLALQSLTQFRKRAIKLPVETTTDQVITVTAAERAGKAVIFDASGNVTVSADDFGTIVVDANAAAAIALEQAGVATSQAAVSTTKADEAEASASDAYASKLAAEAAAEAVGDIPVAAGNDNTAVTVNPTGTGWLYKSAAQFRAWLSLGNAALATIGTAVGNVVGVQTGNKLPALDASDLTGLTRAQIIAALGVKVKRVVTSPNYGMHMVITTDDRLIAWGGNNGAYGFGVVQRAKPTEVQFPGETGTLVDAALSGPTSCWALFSSGNFYAWGDNNQGVLGTGDTVTRQLPVLVATGVTEMFPPTNVSYSHYNIRIFIRKSDGYIYGCGHNSNGQLGLGDTTNRSSFVQLTSLGTTVRKLWNLGATYGCTFAQKNDGSIWFAGYNGSGQCGDGTNGNNKLSFIDVTAAWGGGTAQVQEISGGFGYYTTSADSISSVVMLRAGAVRTCGYNGSGQCGDGTTINRATPYLVPGLGTVTDMVTLGSPCGVFALSSDGKLWRWGYNTYGNLGDGTTTNRLAPYNSGAGFDIAVTRIAIRQYDGHTFGYYTTMFVESGGRMYSCGANNYGSCGTGTAGSNQTALTAVRFSGPLYGIAMCGGGDASFSEMIGYDSKGDVYMWGYGGRYGIDQSSGDNNNVYVPIRKNIGSAC